MPRIFLSIAICYSLVFCLNSNADESSAGPLSVEHAAALMSGAEHACMQPERARKQVANMLQASCVAAAMTAEMDRSEIVTLCYGARHRSTFVEDAEAICGNQLLKKKIL